MGNAFECNDKDGIVVVCPEDTWVNHILGEHPEIKGCEECVKEAIGNPYKIEQDADFANRVILYKPFVLPKPYHLQYLRICIAYRKSIFGKTRGCVITAFSARGTKKGEKLVWQKP